MSIQTQREQFEKNKVIYGSAKLTFLGVDGYDVYNCSTPIRQGGEVYIFGRVEKREVWAGSTVMLFREVAEDTYALVEGAKTYALEDPFVSVIHGEYILGGTHVRKSRGKVDAFYTYFFRGTDLTDLEHFTAGPTKLEKLKDCAFTSGIVPRPDGRVDLYSGLCDCEEGRITIDDPFAAHGGVVERTLKGRS